LDATSARSNFEAQQKVYESRKELFPTRRSPRRDLDSAEVAFLQARSQNEQAQNNLPTCSALEKSKRSNPLKAHAPRPKAECVARKRCSAIRESLVPSTAW